MHQCFTQCLCIEMKGVKCSLPSQEWVRSFRCASFVSISFLRCIFFQLSVLCLVSRPARTMSNIQQAEVSHCSPLPCREATYRGMKLKLLPLWCNFTSAASKFSQPMLKWIHAHTLLPKRGLNIPKVAAAYVCNCAFSFLRENWNVDGHLLHYHICNCIHLQNTTRLMYRSLLWLITSADKPVSKVNERHLCYASHISVRWPERKVRLHT